MNTVSIITVNRNNRDGLLKTIASVAAQTVKPYEFIVIDGASTDGGAELLQEYASVITYSVSEPDGGIYQAMNKGVRAATGDYLLFLNSGDCFHSDTVLEDISHNPGNTDLVIGKLVFLDTGVIFDVRKELTLLHFIQGSLPHGATFIKRDCLVRFPYDESLRIVSDWKFFVQAIVLNNASYSFVDTVVSDFDCNGISSKNRDYCEIERRKVLTELFPERVLSDYMHFLKGAGYEDTAYDRFYIKLRNYKYGSFLYVFNLLIMRFVAVFRKGARWALHFPLNRHSKA